MAREKVRTTLYLNKFEYEYIVKLSKKYSISQSEVIRIIINHNLNISGDELFAN